MHFQAEWSPLGRLVERRTASRQSLEVHGNCGDAAWTDPDLDRGGLEMALERLLPVLWCQVLVRRGDGVNLHLIGVRCVTEDLCAVALIVHGAWTREWPFPPRCGPACLRRICL